jgi:hypothetical protein
VGLSGPRGLAAGFLLKNFLLILKSFFTNSQFVLFCPDKQSPDLQQVVEKPPKEGMCHAE